MQFSTSKKDLQIRKVIYITLFLFVIWIPETLFGQEQNPHFIDSLKSLQFEELYSKQFTEKDTLLNRLYADIYLQKAKHLDSISEMARGYFWISFLVAHNYEKRLIYIDSGIAKVKNTQHVLQTGVMYNTKGIITQQKGNYNKALDYYLTGLEHAEKNNVLYYKTVFNSKIAALKRKLGKYNEAKLLYKKCLQYEKIKINKKARDSLWYLMTLSDLVYTYRLNKEIDSAYYFYNEGAAMSKNMDIKGVYTLDKGILQYYDKDYTHAILTINQGVKEFLNSNYKTSYGYHNLVSGYFFLGKSYCTIHQQEIGIDYFKKIDSIVKQSDDLIPEARQAYPELIKYYKSINDKDNQLLYINRLLYNDSVFHSRYKSTTDKLNKEFDTPILISQKENIIQELKTRNNRSSHIILISSLVILGITGTLFLSYRKNKRYKKRFNDLMIKSEKEIKKPRNTNNNSSSIDIAKDVVELILKGLEDFEKNNGFLEINLTSSILAKKMNTNSKYLTKVIKHYRDKSFSPYINDLRIDHIIERLKADKKIRNYTIKALANEAGFNSTEVFSKSFHKRTGIYPSYFVKNLNL